jgi:hypothetical protein
LPVATDVGRCLRTRADVGRAGGEVAVVDGFAPIGNGRGEAGGVEER